jgi:hypothetical protein
MRVLKYGGMAVAGALIVALSSLMLFLCSTWLAMSAPLVQTMALTALSVCGSGFAALMELSDRHRQHDPVPSPDRRVRKARLPAELSAGSLDASG